MIPKFGFLTNRDRPREPTGRPSRVFATRPYFAGSVGAPPDEISWPAAGRAPLLTMTRASPGSMAVLCEGRRGQGFYICEACGYGTRKLEPKHRTPYGQNCAGRLTSLVLGQEFITDVVRLQFMGAPPATMDTGWFAYSLACALVEGAAEMLEAPSSDINAVVAHASGAPIPPIVLYDNVPGGAGLVTRLEDGDLLRASLEIARHLVSGACKCDPGASCYGCLRSYRNQFAHQYLRRGPVLDFLGELLLLG